MLTNSRFRVRELYDKVELWLVCWIEMDTWIATSITECIHLKEIPAMLYGDAMRIPYQDTTSVEILYTVYTV